MHALQIQQLEKTYASGTHALKGVSFEVEQGDFFALLGPNGSGKTTMINILSGSTKKSEGHIKVFGKDIDRHREETKMMIGVVPQEISSDSFFTVNESLILQSGYYGIRNNQKHIDEILERLNLQDKKHANTRALSGGMKRRLLIAKALVHNPKMLVLDEPTAGVDIELRHSLWKYVRKLNEEGLTILLTTHYLEEAESLCKNTAIISLGRLVALDKTKSLIKSMGSEKILLISFRDPPKTIPKELQRFSPKRINDYELSLTLDVPQIGAALKALDSFQSEIADLDLQGQNLEDVFLKFTNQND